MYLLDDTQEDHGMVLVNEENFRILIVDAP
jgi:hypothetical protein